MKTVFENVSRLKAPAQVALIVGVVALLVVIALNPVAAATLITFMTAVANLAGTGGGGNNKGKAT